MSKQTLDYHAPLDSKATGSRADVAGFVLLLITGGFGMVLVCGGDAPFALCAMFPLATIATIVSAVGVQERRWSYSSVAVLAANAVLSLLGLSGLMDALTNLNSGGF